MVQQCRENYHLPSFARFGALHILFFLLYVLRHPLEAFPITHLAYNAAHEHLKWTYIGISQIDLSLAGGEVGQPHVVTQLIL